MQSSSSPPSSATLRPRLTRRYYHTFVHAHRNSSPGAELSMREDSPPPAQKACPLSLPHLAGVESSLFPQPATTNLLSFTLTTVGSQSFSTFSALPLSSDLFFGPVLLVRCWRQGPPVQAQTHLHPFTMHLRPRRHASPGNGDASHASHALAVITRARHAEPHTTSTSRVHQLLLAQADQFTDASSLVLKGTSTNNDSTGLTRLSPATSEMKVLPEHHVQQVSTVPAAESPQYGDDSGFKSMSDPSSTSSSSSREQSGLSKTALTFIIVAGALVAFLFLVSLALWIARRRRKAKAAKHGGDEEEEEDFRWDGRHASDISCPPSPVAVELNAKDPDGKSLHSSGSSGATESTTKRTACNDEKVSDKRPLERHHSADDRDAAGAQGSLVLFGSNPGAGGHSQRAKDLT